MVENRKYNSHNLTIFFGFECIKMYVKSNVLMLRGWEQKVDSTYIPAEMQSNHHEFLSV